jgi:adenosylcobinamide amidohydrolase
LVKGRKDVVAETGREEARSREARNGRREQADLTETEADPATRMDSITVKSGSSGSHVKLPGGATPIGSEIGEIDATREVGGQIDKKDEAR